MIGINITKWGSYTQHCYCRFYECYSMDTVDNFREGHIDLDAMYQLKSIDDFKAKSEKELMQIASEKLKEFSTKGNPKFWFVAYEGRYSDSRLTYINNI